MPTTTGIAAVPAGRPNVEVQAGAVPGYFLSAATRDEPSRGAAFGQLLALVEPDRLLGTRGLIAGVRRWASSGDGGTEPFAGYRHQLDANFAIAGFGYGTRLSGASQGAAYRATRLGGELALDARIVSITRWLAVHGQASLAATYLDAHGAYCADSDGRGADCSQDGGDRMIDGTIHGVFTSATAGLAADAGRLADGTFHSVRLAVLGSAGTMPRPSATPTWARGAHASQGAMRPDGVECSSARWGDQVTGL